MANLKRTFKGTPYNNKTTGVKASYRMEKEQVDEIRDYLYGEQTLRCVLYAKTMLDKARELAQGSRGYNDRTGNLADSYAYGVYFQGKLVTSGTQRNPQASHPLTIEGTGGTRQSGHEEAMAFLSSYTPRRKDGWEIVWVAAMYYAANLETGTDRPRQYLVLAGILNDVNASFGASNVDVVADVYEAPTF